MDERELIKRAQKLIRRYDNMKIVGSRGEWSGNARQGFNFNPLDGSGGGGGGHGGGGTPPTGACCLEDGTCEIVTPGQCALDGGTFQGTGTECEPNPCEQPATGACCHTDGSCTVTAEDECDGIFQGIGTTCDEVNCDLCFDCTNYFEAFDGSGRKFLTYNGYAIGSHTRVQNDGSVDCTIVHEGESTVYMYYDMSCNLVEQESCSSSRSDDCTPSNVCSPRSTLECFCNSGSPPECDNFCVGFFAWECGFCSGGDCGSDNTVTTADSRVRTVIFCQNCTNGPLTCDISGTYTLTETLSDECF